MFRTTCIALLMAIVASSAALHAAEHKVLIINSYHEGYKWSDDLVAAAEKVLAGKVETKVVLMDTKRKKEVPQIEAAAQEVKKAIDEWQPDLVIAADDNAAKYVIVPFLVGTDTPVVFCGINWDASPYGFPTSNVTGMIEVDLFGNAKKTLTPLAKGDRIGFIGPDAQTSHSNVKGISQAFSLENPEVYLAKDWEDFKKGFIEIQEKCDILIILSDGGLYDANEFAAFCQENTVIPTAGLQSFVARCALITFAKQPIEQGEYAAETALKILAGTSPADIPIAANSKADLFVSLPVSKKLQAKIPLNILKSATVLKNNWNDIPIEEEGHYAPPLFYGCFRLV